MTIRTVTNDAGVTAALAAHVSGDTIEFSGSSFAQIAISGKSDLILTSEDASGKIPSIVFTGTCDNIDCSGLNIQMTGWPCTYPALVNFETGTFSNFQFRAGTTFRHGYGASLVNFDMTSEVFSDLSTYLNIDQADYSPWGYSEDQI